MIDVHTINQKKQKKYLDSYNTEEKNYWCARCKKKKKYIYSYVQTVNKKTKIQSTNHLNSSSHLILIRHYSYVHRFLFSNIYSFMSFYSSVYNKRQGKARALSFCFSEIYFVRLISHLNLQHRFFSVFLFFSL